MKKTITRGQAVSMHGILANMAFGYLADDDLEKMMNNFEELTKLAESYKALNQELHKRLFGLGVEHRQRGCVIACIDSQRDHGIIPARTRRRPGTAPFPGQ